MVRISQIAHKDAGAFEDADDDEFLTIIVFLDHFPEFPYPGSQLFLREQHFFDILLYIMQMISPVCPAEILCMIRLAYFHI